MRIFVRYWLPVLAWMAVIFLASTDLMSARHTSRFIGPFLRWFNPEISAEAILAVQFVVRKSAHVTEYAILGALLLRAVQRNAGRLSWSLALLAALGASAYAALDEFHQSFVASRTGSPLDVLIDAVGVAIGVAICCWVISRREQRSELSLTAPRS